MRRLPELRQPTVLLMPCGVPEEPSSQLHGQAAALAASLPPKPMTANVCSGDELCSQAGAGFLTSLDPQPLPVSVTGPQAPRLKAILACNLHSKVLPATKPVLCLTWQITRPAQRSSGCSAGGLVPAMPPA